MNKYLLSLFCAIFAATAILYFLFFNNKQVLNLSQNEKLESSSIPQVAIGPIPTVTPTPIPSPSPSPIPSPDPTVYGPCRLVPALMYHHIQPLDQALVKKQGGLTVTHDTFSAQLDYLASKGYKTQTVAEFADKVANGGGGRTVLLTFDDAYADFYTYAYPELVKHQFHAVMFVPTGLVGNPDYLTWGQISEMKGSGLITFSDHTWSHKNVGGGTEEAIRYEIATAKSQLEEHGLGPVDTFAYPYGGDGARSEKVLRDLQIKYAFTTIPGSYQCAKLPLEYRRIRIGNSALSSYGL